MQSDCEAYGHDRAIVNREIANAPGNKPWHLSNAKELLVADMSEGKHLTMAPKDLQATREEYMAFSLKVFRDHIYKEVNKDPKCKYRMEKKRKEHETALLPQLLA